MWHQQRRRGFARVTAGVFRLVGYRVDLVIFLSGTFRPDEDAAILGHLDIVKGVAITHRIVDKRLVRIGFIPLVHHDPREPDVRVGIAQVRNNILFSKLDYPVRGVTFKDCVWCAEVGGRIPHVEVDNANEISFINCSFEREGVRQPFTKRLVQGPSRHVVRVKDYK